jgi:predicted metal-dependent hydrolase
MHIELDADRGEIALEGNAAFGVRRSRRARRLRLTLDATGRLLVVLPAEAPVRLAAEMVARHRGWIDLQRARLASERASLAARPPLGAGRLVPLRGIDHLVVLRDAGRPRRRPRIEIEEGAHPVIAIEPATTEPAVVLQRWLSEQARADFGVAVGRRATDLSVVPGRISVRDQRTRWASASPTGGLSFSWRLVLCSPDVLDYVVVHELAHLRWRGHGPRFWGLVRRHVPRADEHRRWLRQNAAALRAALD